MDSIREHRSSIRSILQGVVPRSFKVFGLTSSATPKQRSEALCDIEYIRAAMLEALANRNQVDLARRVRYAVDHDALWYLRTDLMRTLANVEGETLAESKVAQITRLFLGIHPAAVLRTRPPAQPPTRTP